MPGEEECNISVLENLPDAFAYQQLITDRDGNIQDVVFLRVNGAFEAMTGVSRDLIVGKKASQLNGEASDFFMDWNHISGRVAQEEGSTRFEHYAKGIQRWYEVTAYSDRPGYYVTLWRDISHLKEQVRLSAAEPFTHVEDKLRESEERFRYIVEFSPFALAIIDEDGKYEYINPHFYRVFGYTLADIPTGKEWFRLAYPDPGYRREIINAWLEDLRTYGPNVIRPRVFKVTCKDGTVKDIQFRPVMMDNGKQLMISEDITEQIRAEEALKQSEKRFRQVVEASPLPLSISDAEGNNEYLNPRFEEVFGYTLADMPTRKRWFELAYPDPAYRSHVYDIWSKDASNRVGNEFVPRQFRVICKDGNAKEILFRFVLMENGKRLIIYEDITERIKAEKEIQARNLELSTLYNLSTHMRAAQSSADLLPIVLDESCALLNADFGMIILLEPDQEQGTISVGSGQWSGSMGKSISLKQGCFSIVLTGGKPYVSSELSVDENALSPDFAGQTGPAVFVPLQSREAVLGIIVLARPRQAHVKPFSDAEVHLLTAIAEMAGNALHRQQLHERAQERMNQLQALRKIDMAITGSTKLEDTLEVVLFQVTTMLNVDAAAILSLSGVRKILQYEAWHGFHNVSPKELELNVGEGYAGRCVFERCPIHIPDLRRAEPDPVQSGIMAAEGFAAYFAVPLIARGQVYGVLEVLHRKPLNPANEWLKYMETLAGQAAIAVENDRLFTDLQESNLELTLAYDATIEGWAYALDLKDEETEGHSRRVTEMTVRMASALGVSDEYLLHIRRGALLHDIGKMGIPDKVLLKPGKLTEQEWAIMQQHPRYAYEMLSTIDYLRPAINIPFCHHEKWNGSGYPRKLKGEDIPLEARIFAVVDVYDALTSDRPYRPAWKPEQALDLIRKDRGSHFDPQVVDLFLRKIKSG